MEIVFGTTNARKVDDLQKTINEMGLDITARSMADVGWDRGEIDEPENTLEGNSLVKAQAIHDFLKEHNIDMPVVTDDAGLYVEVLGDEPGVETARYAEEEIKQDPSLPKYQGVIKLLEKLKDEENRKAYYRCVVTTIYPDGSYTQDDGRSYGTIATEILGDLTKPYFWSVFVLEGTDTAFNRLEENQLENTYRRVALRKTLTKLNEHK